jgi:hypothetical protein
MGAAANFENDVVGRSVTVPLFEGGEDAFPVVALG